jgi:serine/threonine protein kinase
MVGAVFLNRYRAVTLLGKGSVGTVYLARHLDKPEIVVVKVVHPHVASDPTFRPYFDREIESLSRLKHPNVVGFLDAAFDDPNGPCLLMEFIPGITLEKLLQRTKPLPPERVFQLLVPLCRALTAAHALSVIHRDLKPANLMIIDPNTDHESLKVMDFGFAHVNRKPHIALERLKGQDAKNACGTPVYVAPDGLRGDPVDHRADIYSVGVILYEMLVGVPPFHYAEAATILNAHIKDRPPRFADSRPGGAVSPDIEAVVLRCLDKYPNERPQSAVELAEEFAHAIGVSLSEKLFPMKERVDRPGPSAVPAPPSVPAQTDGGFKVVQLLEAWMPEPIAVVKLRGFVSDHKGDVLDSQPGIIRVQFGQRPLPPPDGSASKSTLAAWFKKVRAQNANTLPAPDPIEMTLHLSHQPGQQSHLKMTIVFRPLDGCALTNPPQWRQRCDALFHNLRGYLMAN